MLIRWLCKIVMHTFFSRVRVHHSDRVPATGAVLLVSNHHSSLVDPVALLATMRRQPRFLAKAALWGPAYIALRPFLALARAIPVHRHVDGGGDNSSMFAASHDALAAGDVIALFAEGRSHDMPGLLDLKTGAARIALGTPAAVAIVPVGLIYDDRSRFRSRAMVYVGEPLMVEGRLGGDEDRESVRSLTDELAMGLDEVAPSWASWEAHNAAVMAARLTVADSPHVQLGEAVTQINRAVDGGTTEGDMVLAAMADLEAESARLGLDIETVVDRPRNRVDRLNRLTFLATALLVVPTLVGRLVNMPPHGLIGRLASRQDLNFQATFKIIAAVFLYPLWWLLVAGALAFAFTPWVGGVALVAMPVLGYLAARLFGRLRRFRNRRAVRSRATDVHGEAGLIEHRHRVLNATAAILSSAAPPSGS